MSQGDTSKTSDERRPVACASEKRTPLPGRRSPSGTPGSSDAWAASSLRLGSPVLGNLIHPADLTSPSALPAVGSTFLGFHLVAELGRGSFGRVYLAQQGELAGRLVALKVSTEIVTESQRLARLQHTHIVPIHSLHRAGPLQAVCMPYFGPTTLADVLQDLVSSGVLPVSGKGLVGTLHDRRSRTARSRNQPLAPASDPAPSAPLAPQPPLPEVGDSTRTLKMLEGLSYVEAILWIAARLADGLGHAHERGILHRDLKPANVLLTDEGQPMLLDFNLSEDTHQPSGAHVGGTLPYMAPEHLAAFSGAARVVDARSDLYSLGVLLFELLTGRQPFGRIEGPTAVVLPQMILQRLGPPPGPRTFQPTLPRAVDAIVRKCLESDPVRRYQSAADLREDLERQLSHRPLRHAPDRSLSERAGKWVRRHPRLAVIAPVLLTAAVGLALLAELATARGRQAADQQVRAERAESRGEELGSELEARANLTAFRAELAQARLLLCARGEHRGELDRGLDLARRALARIPSADPASPALRPLSPEERARARGERGELLLLLAGTTIAGQDAAAALVLNFQAEICFDDQPPRALFEQRADLAHQAGLPTEAERARRDSEQTPLRDALDRYLLARLEGRRGHYAEALALLRQATELDPRQPAAWTLLGHLCLDGLGGRQADAAGHYSAALALVPNDAALLGHRGLARFHRREFREAEADLAHALDLEPAWALLHQHHARVVEELANEEERAGRSRQAVWLRLRALDELGQVASTGQPTNLALLARARLRTRLGDRAGAARDRATALRLTPSDAPNAIARGLALREVGDVQGALADFEAAARSDPHSLVAWRNQSHILSDCLHRNRDALAALDRILQLQPTLAGDWSTRAVLAARLGEVAAARRAARQALELDPTAPVQYQNAGAYALLARHAERRWAAVILANLLGRAPANWREQADALRQGAAADRTEALRLIGRAFIKGYGFELLEIDPDLEPLRSDPRYGALEEMRRMVRRLPARD